MNSTEHHLFRILILEDDLTFLVSIYSVLLKLEKAIQETVADFYIAPVNFSEVSNSEKFIREHAGEFHLILLDRDSADEKDFHVIEITRATVLKVIAISTVEEFNNKLKKRGVTRIIKKDYSDVKSFETSLYKEAEQSIVSFLKHK